MRKFAVSLFILSSLAGHAQNDRVSDYNNTNWFQTINTIRLNKHWSLHAEYQWRRLDGLKYWQQGMIRVGANYKWNDNITVHAGYAWAETFSYGDYPIAVNGTFPEHRLYEQLTIKQDIKRLVFNHRFRVEQRWNGQVKPNTGDDREIEKWSFTHRFRYQFRVQYPLLKRNKNLPYFAAADEVFISAGKNVGANIFDQNRIFLLFGFKFNDKLSIEGGYFNQTLQQGRRINNTTIMQRNNGLVIGSFLTL